MDLVANYGSSSEDDSSNDEEEVPQPIKKRKIEKSDKLRSFLKLSDIKQKIANLEAEEAELIEESKMGKLSKVKTNAKSLLQGLPEPCNGEKKETESKNPLMFVPRKIKKEKEVKEPEVITNEIEDDLEEDNEGCIDMFGMSSSSSSHIPYENIETKPSLEIFINNNISGPCRPMPTTTEGIPEEEEGVSTGPGTITKEQANELIYRHELAQWGISREAAARIETNITDVNIDSSLGPNVESTIRANMHYGNAALILNASKVNPKNPMSKLAKQKHQITYLADLAMKNDDKLREQWANNKSKRKLAAQRYGFK